MANRVNDVLSDEEIVALVDYENMTYQEIADDTGFHEKTIGKHYRQEKKRKKEAEMVANMPFTPEQPEEPPVSELMWEKEQREKPQSWWEKLLDFFGLY